MKKITACLLLAFVFLSCLQAQIPDTLEHPPLSEWTAKTQKYETISGDSLPEIEPIAPVFMLEGDSTMVNVSAINTINLEVINWLPAFVEFSDLGNGSGVFAIHPGNGADGTYTITLRATNSVGSDTTSFTINVSTNGELIESICEIARTELIVGGGDPRYLFDEQEAAGDPANGPGGTPVIYWFPGWFEENYPAEAYIDLGTSKTLTRLFLRDVQGYGPFEVFTGVPGNWNPNPLVSDNLRGYHVWNEHDLNIDTRYLKFKAYTDLAFVGEVLIYGMCTTFIDELPPVPINTLSANTLSAHEIVLNWLAPVDPGTTGLVATYDLRYSTAPIDDNNFANANIWPTNAPQPGGSPESVTISGLECGTTYYFALKSTDAEGNTSLLSNVVNAATVECPNSNQITIQLQFSATPSELPQVTIAPLRYNKDFAYSLSLDDGSPWEYENVFPILQGGMHSGYETQNEPPVYEPGKFYTDGCGNNIPFRAGLSINAEKLMEFVQENSYMSWDNVAEIYQAGWDIFNHSYTHCNVFEGNCDYTFEVTENTAVLAEQLNFTTTHFVVPTSDNNGYINPAFANGMVALYTQNYGAPGEYSTVVSVDGSPDLNDFVMLRNDLQYETVPYGEDIDEVASQSTGGVHQWFCEYAHRIGNTVVPSGQAPYVHVSTHDFRNYMEYIENQYGKDGTDRVWVASMQTVYEYLVARVSATYQVSPLNNNQMTITINTSNIPGSLRYKALSFMLNSDQPFTATATGANLIHNGHNLINIDW